MPQQADRISGLCVPLPRVTGALMLAPIQGYQENAWCLHDHSPLFTLKNSSDVSPMDSNRCACSYRPWSLLRKHSRPSEAKEG